MKELMSAHWEKMILALSLAFGGFSFWHGSQAGSLVSSAESQFLGICQAISTRAGQDPDEAVIQKPGIDQALLRIFNEVHSATYAIPTSPSAGFENLGELPIQEGKGTSYTPPFSDPDIRKAFGKLNNPDISINVSPEGIVEWKIGADGSSIDIKALKFGEAILTLKDKTLKGAHVKIRVKQSLRIRAFVPESTLKAAADPVNLNLVTLSWEPALVSHKDLAHVGTYTLHRQSLDKDMGPDTAPWETLQSWDGAANPGTFQDTQVATGRKYRYKLSITFQVRKEFEERDYPSQVLPEGAFPLAEDEGRDYLPSTVISIATGVQLMGFVGVQDPGEQGATDKNKTANVAIKIWHRYPDGRCKWIAGSFQLESLRVPFLHKPDRGAIDKLIRVSKKNQTMGPSKEKLSMDVVTDWLLFNIQVHKAGDVVQGTTFIDKEELKRISDDGKTYKADTRSFWIVDANDPYFTNPKVTYPKSRKVLHENKDLHHEVKAVNAGDTPLEAPTPPKPVSGDTPAPPKPTPLPETPSPVTGDSPAAPEGPGRTR